jgi:REP element-mobilizing transposase RayT
MMGLSVPGCIAWYFWRDIPNHQANIALDEFVVMPNHLHGIIGIKSSAGGVRTLHATSVHELHATSVHEHEEAKNKMAEISPKAGSLSAILRSYKSAITKWCNSHNHAYFGWHTRFYDHIVRNEKDLRRIRQYIFDNPINWERDRENNSGNEIHERGVEYMIGNDSNTRVQA